MQGKVSIIKAGVVTDQAKILKRTSLFGSGGDCQVRIKSNKVAPILAELSFLGGKVLFKRLASLGDLFRNDSSICSNIGDMIELFDGDKLRIGTTEFQWSIVVTQTMSEPEPQSLLVKREKVDPKSEKDTTASEHIIKGPTQLPLSPARATRSSQGKASPKKEVRPIAPTQMEGESESVELKEKQRQVKEAKPAPKIVDIVESQEINAQSKDIKVDSNSQKSKDKKPTLAREKSRKNKEVSVDGQPEIRLTRRLSKEPSAMILEKASFPPVNRKTSNEKRKEIESEKPSESVEKESQSEAKPTENTKNSNNNKKRKREESEEELHTAERNRHVKTRRLSVPKNDERVFEPNPMQPEDIEALLIPILVKTLEEKEEATIFEFEEAVESNPKATRAIREEELNIRDQLYQALVGNKDRFVTGDIVLVGPKSAMSWRAASSLSTSSKKSKISTKDPEPAPRESRTNGKPASNRGTSGAGKTAVLPKKHSATTEDKMEEDSKEESEKSEESEESEEEEPKPRPKKAAPKQRESKQVDRPSQLRRPLSASLSNDPMEIEMDIAAEFKKFEKEIRALVSADVKKAKEMKEAGTLPKWELSEDAKKQSKKDLRAFPKSQIQDLLLFLIKKFMSQSHNFELDDEENCYSDHVEHHWLPFFAKLIISSRS